MLNKLKYFRKVYDKTQLEVARDLNISISKYTKAEQGIQGTSDRLKKKMAEYFQTTVGVLFFEDPITNSNTKLPECSACIK